jgi:LysR substrate binding domain
MSIFGARPAIAGEFTSGYAVKRCVEAGTAIGVLALISVTTELDTGRLIALPWNGPALALSSYLVANQQRWVSPAAVRRHRVRRRVVGPACLEDAAVLVPARHRGQGDSPSAPAVHGRARERDDRGGAGVARLVRVPARGRDPAYPAGRRGDLRSAAVNG